ncbi:MAG: tRNA glutamyl-Q(34) synthetase GluQRS [Helicobacteraceae bacterium]|nr:tRNA glutamyl-Q(34) synthetase GluQRS [Helicobacteraceae bacterium]
MIVGRFAPTPSGDLHFGSLVAAVGSFVSAKSKGGKWLVRIEDTDRARSVKGADLEILRTLERYELFWDGEIWRQSERFAIYFEFLDRLKNFTYECFCSRSDLAPFGKIHPPSCVARVGDRAAIRVRVLDREIIFHDRIVGGFKQNLRAEVGDFVLKNRGGEPSYHLACVIDDHLSGVSEIVRGRDLLDSAPRQIYLQNLFGFSTPDYAHLPLVLGADGAKLSKQNKAEPIAGKNPRETLIAALNFLGYDTPADLTIREALDREICL